MEQNAFSTYEFLIINIEITMQDHSTGQELWQGFIRFYRLPDVEPLLLKLQDNNGLDVNQVLLAGCLAEQGISWQADYITEEYVQWREEGLKPIRAVRQTLKHLPSSMPNEQEEVRKQIKSIELEVEKHAIKLLWAVIADDWSQNLIKESHVSIDLLSQNVGAAISGMGLIEDIKKGESDQLIHLLATQFETKN